MCVDKTEAHFFGIGDWGGDQGGGHTWENPGKYEKRGARVGGDDGPDEMAQLYVAREMRVLAESADPDFVLNAGDNFYPGGLSDPGCGAEQANLPASSIWGDNYETLYYGKGLDEKPWLSVLGNHDYGGRSYTSAWDAQIFHTWDSNNVWRMPGQFWSQRVQYSGFSVEIYMLESNYQDALPLDPLTEGRNICQGRDDWQPDCWGLSLDSCVQHFVGAWTASLDMLEERLSKTDADWKIINTHYPGTSIASDPRIKDLNIKYGIDLIFTGHSHFQQHGVTNDIPWIISGGGGGITSDVLPDINGHDDAYGFVDFTVNKDSLKFDMRTWGGMEPSPDGIIRKSETISKRSKNASLAGQLAFI